MLLREHPLMSRRGVRNWPPAWTWIDGREDKRPRGEIGTLNTVSLTKLNPANCCYMYIDHEGSSYMGCLLFDDPAFCGQITKLLEGRCNRPIGEIGSLDLSHTL
jgi:hypothetical protein